MEQNNHTRCRLRLRVEGRRGSQCKKMCIEGSWIHQRITQYIYVVFTSRRPVINNDLVEMKAPIMLESDKSNRRLCLPLRRKKRKAYKYIVFEWVIHLNQSSPEENNVTTFAIYHIFWLHMRQKQCYAMFAIIKLSCHRGTIRIGQTKKR